MSSHRRSPTWARSATSLRPPAWVCGIPRWNDERDRCTRSLLCHTAREGQPAKLDTPSPLRYRRRAMADPRARVLEDFVHSRLLGDRRRVVTPETRLASEGLADPTGLLRLARLVAAGVGR